MPIEMSHSLLRLAVRLSLSVRMIRDVEAQEAGVQHMSLVLTSRDALGVKQGHHGRDVGDKAEYLVLGPSPTIDVPPINAD